MDVLAPVRYPLAESSRKTLQRAIDLAAEDGEEGHVTVLHVNLVHEGGRTSRRDLRAAVRREFGSFPAHFVVRDGFILEEAILDEAVGQGVDAVVVGASRRGRIERAIRRLTGEVDLGRYLRENLSMRLVVVD
jgi:nucleotide-binding universal stress UspA family protein